MIITLTVSRATMRSTWLPWAKRQSRSIRNIRSTRTTQRPPTQQRLFALNALLLAYVFRALSNFMPSRSAPSAIDDKTAAAEGAWAFHVANHNQAFASTDCCSSDALFRTMFSDSEVAKKFSCAASKTKAILTGLFVFMFLINF